MAKITKTFGRNRPKFQNEFPPFGFIPSNSPFLRVLCDLRGDSSLLTGRKCGGNTPPSEDRWPTNSIRFGPA